MPFHKPTPHVRRAPFIHAHTRVACALSAIGLRYLYWPTRHCVANWMQRSPGGVPQLVVVERQGT